MIDKLEFFIALANLAVLFLVRAARSGDVTAVRMALGASRWNLARAHFAEGALLVVAGTMLALLLARWGIGAAMYWIGPAGAEQDAGPGTDFDAIRRGAVSVTPLQIDLTRYDAIDGVARWLEDTTA